MKPWLRAIVLLGFIQAGRAGEALEEESSGGDEGDCWTSCHPDFRHPDSVDCTHCAQPTDINTWKGDRDFGLSLDCNSSPIVFSFRPHMILSLKQPWVNSSWHIAVNATMREGLVTSLANCSVGEMKQTAWRIDNRQVEEACITLTTELGQQKAFCEECAASAGSATQLLQNVDIGDGTVDPEDQEWGSEGTSESGTTSTTPSCEEIAPWAGNCSSCCNFTESTLPHPRIVLLGPTGVGKSSFGNRLFGITEDNNKTAVCSQFCGWYFDENPETRGWIYLDHIFGVGHEVGSKTIETSWMVGHYLGDPNNGLITIIDTPGTGDTDGRDCEHGIALAKGVKRIGKIDAFMILLNSKNARFSEPLQDQMKLYQNIFGKEMWENTIIEFTYWGHSHSENKKRKKQRKLTIPKQMKFWNKVFGEKFRLDKKLPMVFVDPVFEEEYGEPKEVEINKKHTDKLWKLLTEDPKPYTCGKRCQAPSGFFSGHPWLLEDGSTRDQRLGALATVTWQIWFAGCRTNRTRSYTIAHVDTTNVTTELYKSVFDNGTSTADDSKLPAGIEVKDEAGEKFITIRLKIESLEDKHFGSYFVVNEKGTSKPGQVNQIIDGEWQEWGPFGNCSKTCIRGNENTGKMIRWRTCTPPVNGGIDCSGPAYEEKQCAHGPGDEPGFIRWCPVDAQWGPWTSWSACTSRCVEEDGPVPTKSRFRTCIEASYGGKGCSSLNEEAKANNEPTTEEKPNCSDAPNCPRNAWNGEWSDWSACTVTCYNESQTQPQQIRIKPCVEASFSSDEALNTNIITCEKLGEAKEFNFCPIKRCPVPPEWMEWTPWTSCSRTCGPRGNRQRSRSYIPGKFGAESQPEGGQTMVQNCSTTTIPGWPTCPVGAGHGNWGGWSECSKTCFNEGSFPPMRERRRECIPAILSSNPDFNHNIVTCAKLPDIAETQMCHISPCQVPAEWNQWTPWTSCSRTCGLRATRQKTRNYIPGKYGAKQEPEGHQTMVQNCSTATIPGWATCPISAVRGNWGSWSECSKTCYNEDSFPPMIERSRECTEATMSTNPDLNNNIVTCATLPEIKEEKQCRIPRCQVPAKWMEWSDYSDCSPSCGEATRKRSRGFFPGRHGASYEPEVNGTNPRSHQTEPCSPCPTAHPPCSPQCPTAHTFGNWESWTSCPTECYAEGTRPPRKERRKPCIEGQGEGIIPCSEVPKVTESDTCDTPICPVPPEWMQWSPWSSCSQTCGTGATRHRSRISTPGRHLAPEDPKTPKGNQMESDDCVIPTCPKSATHGEWESWAPCDKKCIKEGSFPPIVERRRKCIEAVLSSDPDLNNNIVTCMTLREIKETKQCKASPCPVPAKWTLWTAWSSCTHTCGSTVATRQRFRNAIPGRYPTTERPLEGKPDQYQNCVTPTCPKPATYGSWSDWTSCITCFNEGTLPPMQERKRECIPAILSDNTDLNHELVTCAKLPEIKDRQLCEIDPCTVPAKWMEWTDWTSCTHTCGSTAATRQRSRNAIPGKYPTSNQPLKGDPEESENCVTPTCPVPATYGSWTDWSSCSKTCYEEGILPSTSERKKRCTRAILSNDTTLNNIVTCKTLPEKKETKLCQIPPCPVDATWMEWTDWSSCPVTCGIGQRQRHRTYVPGRYGGKRGPPPRDSSGRGSTHAIYCDTGETCGCFSGSSTVETLRGPTQLSSLKLNDAVLTYTPGVGTHYTEFLGWLDRSSTSRVSMLKISTLNSSSLTLTPSHVVFRLSSIGAIEAVQASQLVEGDRLIRPTQDGMAELVDVLDIKTTLREIGYWTPLTREGTLLANGFLVSCYASFPHHQSELAFALVKTFPRLLLDDQASQHEDGVRKVVSVLKKIGEMVGLRRRPAEMENHVHTRQNIEFKAADHKMPSLGHHTEL